MVKAQNLEVIPNKFNLQSIISPPLHHHHQKNDNSDDDHNNSNNIRNTHLQPVNNSDSHRIQVYDSQCATYTC
jgi:hypothetical protein